MVEIGTESNSLAQDVIGSEIDGKSAGSRGSLRDICLNFANESIIAG